ncbi:MAG TPA: amylo-alpha-1,6-glucosidase, partial [Burkholderiaceae bacterium]
MRTLTAVLLVALVLCKAAGADTAAPLPAWTFDGHAGHAPLAPPQGIKPGAAVYFSNMALAVPNGVQRQFVAGDNVAGYFEGYTHSYTRGAGYVFDGGARLMNYMTYADARRNERTGTGAQETVLPFGHRVLYRGGRGEAMALLSGEQAIAFEASSSAPAQLAISPLLALPLAQLRIERKGDAVVLSALGGAADKPVMYMALAADRPWQLLRAPDDASRLLLQARETGQRFTAVAAFGTSADAAADHAQRLAASDPLRREMQVRYERLTASYLVTSDAQYNRALEWAKAASDVFVVEQYGKGIWAGLPWFRDNWGRDTFIALPGTLLVAGRFDEARAVLDNFARYQNLRDPASPEYGRVPNRVAAGDSIIYNTVDGTPWMLREALEYIRYTGDRAFAARMLVLAKAYFAGAFRHHVDRDGLLTHGDADTWMDARIEGKQAWSPRGPRAVEIQALWYTALQAGAELAQLEGDAAQAAAWRAHAARVRTAFLKLYWDGAVMADRLRADGTRDTKVRPNQLMLLSIPFDDFIGQPVQARVLRNAVSQLLYPHGVASLAATEPYFHPLHVNDPYHHKDAAYHQGTIWGWNAGFTVTGLTRFGYQDLAYRLARNLGRQMMDAGALGNMSELVDALPGPDGAIKPSGTYAQSWSVAEYARNGYQDFLGFRPDLVRGELVFEPALPAAWSSADAVLPFGRGESLQVQIRRDGKAERWAITLNSRYPRQLKMRYLRGDGSRAQVLVGLKRGVPAVLE